MKIAVYNAKGGVGKTPIATNIALDREFAIGTNEYKHIYEGFIDEERLLSLSMEEEFPDIPDNIDIVFDLAGSISPHSYSITSALKQADLVIVPVNFLAQSLIQTVGVLPEIKRFTNNILIVATMLEREGKEKIQDWRKSEAYLSIKSQLEASLGHPINILPLKLSKAFEAIFRHEKSIRQIMKDDPLLAYSYREIANQFDEIYKFID